MLAQRVVALNPTEKEVEGALRSFFDALNVKNPYISEDGLSLISGTQGSSFTIVQGETRYTRLAQLADAVESCANETEPSFDALFQFYMNATHSIITNKTPVWPILTTQESGLTASIIDYSEFLERILTKTTNIVLDKNKYIPIIIMRNAVLDLKKKIDRINASLISNDEYANEINALQKLKFHDPLEFSASTALENAFWLSAQMLKVCRPALCLTLLTYSCEFLPDTLSRPFEVVAGLGFLTFGIPDSQIKFMKHLLVFMLGALFRSEGLDFYQNHLNEIMTAGVILEVLAMLRPLRNGYEALSQADLAEIIRVFHAHDHVNHQRLRP